MLHAVPSDYKAGDLAPVTLSIRRLSLTGFRNYAQLDLTCDRTPVVLTGANGGGKTNLLEAISLLVPGRGLRRADLADLQNHNEANPWAVAAELSTAAGLIRIGTGRDPEESENERRLIQIDGRPARSQSALAEICCMAWITPEMDRVLAESPGARRKLIDRLTYSFDAAHQGRVQRYEKAMRERLRLLREGRTEAGWLSALEDEMARSGVAIAAARRHMLRELQSAIAEAGDAFPHADLALKGLAEEALDQEPALTVEDMLRAALYRNRGEDAQAGMTKDGPHRTDLIAVHREKLCPAELCSTGEQKALLIAIMLAYVRVLTRQWNMAPLFLLDDIAAHLDDVRRHALFEELRALGVQAWLTGTDAEPFAGLLPHARHYVVEMGEVKAA